MTIQEYYFGSFCLDAGRGDLRRDGVPVPIGGRARKLLVALLAQAGGTVGKEALMQAAWPDLLVEESNLTVQITGLRQILDDTSKPHKFITTVPGVGYRFAGLRAPAPAMIGRETELTTLLAALTRHRLVTITGSGGIGKTTLAMAALAEYAADPANKPILLRLETLHRPGQAAERLAGQLGLLGLAGDAAATVAEHFRRAPPLLIIDNCEHLTADIAALAALILACAPKATILATSREPLGAADEFLLRLGPLAFPAAESSLAAHDLGLPAMRLFAERASLKLDAQTAGVVATICRRLEGIPLAIELAAARLPSMSLHELKSGLGDQLGILRGSATAPSRQRTLEATIAWSFWLLSPAEQEFLACVSVFSGSFNMPAAQAVAAVAQADRLIESLAGKSLLVAAPARANLSRYRLLESTRAFALARLGGAAAAARRRLLDYFTSFYRQSEVDYKTMATEPFLEIYAADWDNAQAGLEWAFEPGGDVLRGQRLAAMVGAIMLELQMMGMTDWFKAALARIDATTPPDVVAALRYLQTGGTGSGSVARAGQAREALAFYRQTGDQDGLGEALTRLGMALTHPDDVGPAEACFEEAARVFRQTGHLRYLASNYGFRSYCRSLAGDAAGAEALARDCLTLATEIGCRRVTQEARAWLAELAFTAGQTEEAMRLAREVIASSNAAGQMSVMFHMTARLAAFLTSIGNFAEVLPVVSAALKVFTGDQVPLILLLSDATLALTHSGRLADAVRVLGYVQQAIRVLASTFNDEQAEASREAAKQMMVAKMPPPTFEALLAEGRGWNEEQLFSALRFPKPP